MTSTPFVAGRVGEERDRLQQAVRVRCPRPGASSCRRSPRSGSSSSVGLAVELLDLRLAAEVRDGLVAVEPDVFELVLGHPFTPCSRCSRERKKAPPLRRVVRPHCLRARRRRRRTYSTSSGPGGCFARADREQAVGGVLDLQRRVVDRRSGRASIASSSRRMRWQSSPRSTSTCAESAGKPELISQTCRSWTSVTPGCARDRRADLARERCPRAPPRGGSRPTARSSGQAAASIDAATASDAIGSARSKPVVQTTSPATAVAGERVEVGEQVAVAALDVQVRAVRARDLPERDDVDDGADERRRDDERRRARPAGETRRWTRLDDDQRARARAA